jgi:hypothetical protein
VSNKVDFELSGDARRIIAEARGVDDPTAEDRERVKARWLASIAIAAGVSSFSDTARATSSGGWALKGTALALAVAAGAAGLYVMLPDTELASRESVPLPAIPLPAEVAAPEVPAAERPLAAREVEASPGPLDPSGVEAEGRGEAMNPAEPSARQESRVPVAAPQAREAANPEPTLAVDSTPRRVAKAERSSVVAEKMVAEKMVVEKESPGEAAATNGQLSEEIALLSRVRAGVREGAGTRALELLAEYRERFERPILGMEAAALGVDALCQTGQRDAARAAADNFRNRWPKSPLEQRVSAACTQF